MAQISIGSNLYVPAEKFGFRPLFRDGLKGFLHKQGHTVKNWKMRYFVLDATNHSLRYYTDETTQQLQGEWKLTKNSSALSREDSIDDRDHIIELVATRASTGENDKLYLSARSTEDKKQWLNAIRETIKDGLIEVTQPDLWDRFWVDFYIKVSLSDDTNNISITDGLIVELSQAINPPKISFPSKGMSSSPFYTFAILDMDYPSRGDFNRRLYLLQLKVNLSDTDVSGREILPYICPSYEDDTLHRIFFVTFAQQGFIDPNSARIDRDYFSPKEFAKRFGCTRPVAIEGCYFSRKAISETIAENDLSNSCVHTKQQTSSDGENSIGNAPSNISPAQRKNKKFKYYSQHAKRASLTLDNTLYASSSNCSTQQIAYENHTGSNNMETMSEPPLTPINSTQTITNGMSDTPPGRVLKITQLSDESQLDDYLALPFSPDSLSRDTSAASTATTASKRVSFISDASTTSINSPQRNSLGNGKGNNHNQNNTSLVSVLKRPGSKKFPQKKTVSFVANEVKYVATDIPDDVEMDVYQLDDTPDYDTSHSPNAFQSKDTAKNTAINSSPTHSPHRPAPKSISANTSRMVTDSLSQNNEMTETTEKMHIINTKVILNDNSSIATDGIEVSNGKLSDGEKCLDEKPFREVLLMSVTDPASACQFFCVSNENIFAGEILNKKFSSDFTFKNSFVWVDTIQLRIYWAKSRADKDIASRNKFLSLDGRSANESVANDSVEGCKGICSSVTLSSDRLSLVITTRDGSTLTLKSSNADRLEEWSIVLRSILTHTSTS